MLTIFSYTELKPIESIVLFELIVYLFWPVHNIGALKLFHKVQYSAAWAYNHPFLFWGRGFDVVVDQGLVMDFLYWGDIDKELQATSLEDDKSVLSFFTHHYFVLVLRDYRKTVGDSTSCTDFYVPTAK